MHHNTRNSFSFLTINEWILENEKKPAKQSKQVEEPTYGCVMLEPAKIKGWVENHLGGIDEEDIFEKPNDDSYGLEEQPHITVLYGIHEDEVDPSVVVDMMKQKLVPIKVTISEIGIFENDEFDVVKYEVPVTEELQAAREMFMEAFENTQTYPDYHPHMTLGYVKKGAGKKYKKVLDEPFEVEFVKGVYSYHNDEGERLRKIAKLENPNDE